jgi:hypothetical protein
VRLNGSQFGVLFLLLAAMGLEFVFSPYWHPFIQDNLGGTGADGKQKLKISSEGFIVIAFLLFATILILTLTGIFPTAGYAVAGLLLLAVVLARAQPIIDWIDVTTATLKTASGA